MATRAAQTWETQAIQHAYPAPHKNLDGTLGALGTPGDPPAAREDPPAVNQGRHAISVDAFGVLRDRPATPAAPRAAPAPQTQAIQQADAARN